LFSLQPQRSTLFADEVRRIWAFLAPQNFLSKDQFIAFFTKSALVLIPPPVDKEVVLQMATEDWVRDLERAQDQKMTNEAGDELSFDAFYKSIYELVDTWCETAEIAEYMDMIRRLIGGAIERDSTGAMCWRSDFDIVYDRHFSMAGDEDEVDGDAEESQDVYGGESAQGLQQFEEDKQTQVSRGMQESHGEQGTEGALGSQSAVVEGGRGSKGAHEVRFSEEAQSSHELHEARSSELNQRSEHSLSADGAQEGQGSHSARGFQGAQGTGSTDREGAQQVQGTQETQGAIGYHKAQNSRTAQNAQTIHEDRRGRSIDFGTFGTEGAQKGTAESSEVQESEKYQILKGNHGSLEDKEINGSQEAQDTHGGQSVQGTQGAQDAKVDRKSREARDLEMGSRKAQEANPQESIIEEDNDPSTLQHLAPKRRRKRKGNMLPVEKCNDLIAYIFQAKQKADLWAIKNGNDASLIRFDRFVLRYFMSQVGMLGAARRHLRFFVRSAMKHLHASSNGREELPRIYLFCCLTGLESPTPDGEFNPRLSAEYFQPALRSLFPDPMKIEAGFLVRKSKRDSTVPTAPFKELEKACIPLTLQAMVGGNNAIEHYRRDLGPHTTKGLCNLDLGLTFALSLWVFMDAMRGMRERAALRTLQRWFQRRQARVANETKNIELTSITSVPSEMAKDHTEAATFSSIEMIKEESAVDNSLPNVEVPPSPRVTERLNDARNLDAQLNSGATPDKMAETPAYRTN